jgi:hypothetical protein
MKRATCHGFAQVRPLRDKLPVSYCLEWTTQPPLSFVQPGVHVQAKDITNLGKFAARGTNLEAQGYNLARIGTHSHCASGAMALKLQGVNNATNMKIGWWTGLTFFTYIHAQISALNAGVWHNEWRPGSISSMLVATIETNQ